MSLEAGKHLMKSHQVAGDSDPCCRAEPNVVQPPGTEQFPCQQLRSRKVFPGLESSIYPDLTQAMVAGCSCPSCRADSMPPGDGVPWVGYQQSAVAAVLGPVSLLAQPC